MVPAGHSLRSEGKWVGGRMLITEDAVPCEFSHRVAGPATVQLWLGGGGGGEFEVTENAVTRDEREGLTEVSCNSAGGTLTEI